MLCVVCMCVGVHPQTCVCGLRQVKRTLQEMSKHTVKHGGTRLARFVWLETRPQHFHTAAGSGVFSRSHDHAQDLRELGTGNGGAGKSGGVKAAGAAFARPPRTPRTQHPTEKSGSSTDGGHTRDSIHSHVTQMGPLGRSRHVLGRQPSFCDGSGSFACSQIRRLGSSACREGWCDVRRR